MRLRKPFGALLRSAGFASPLVKRMGAMGLASNNTLPSERAGAQVV